MASEQFNHLETFLFIKFPLLKDFIIGSFSHMMMCRLSSKEMTKGGDYEEGLCWTNLTLMGQGQREKKFELKILSHLERVHG
jgi:hypothetical protein